MIFLYRILFLPAFLLALPHYLMHMIKRGGYGEDLRFRFGILPIIPKNQNKKRIWLQAVSVGEINAIEKLIDLLSADNRLEIFLTTTSSTGYALARKKYSSKVLFIGLFPWDFWLFSKIAWTRINPDFAILMESELWPEHMHQAKTRKVPVYLLNARMSNKSFKRFSLLKFFGKKLLNQLSLIIASGKKTYDYMLKIGVKNDKIILGGNIKFDCNSDTMSTNEIMKLKIDCGFSPESHIILGSSTWPTEEKMLLDALKNLRKTTDADWRLLICPRHAERRDEITKVLKTFNFKWHMRSTGIASEQVDVCLADTTGELRNLTQISDFAFVGKSLEPNNGGQSPLDAAAYGIPIIYGDRMLNFREICADLESHNCVVKVRTHEDAIKTIINLANEKNAQIMLSENLTEWHSKHVGASQFTYKTLINKIFQNG